jgi:hypothetical protein
MPRELPRQRSRVEFSPLSAWKPGRIEHEMTESHGVLGVFERKCHMLQAAASL